MPKTTGGKRATILSALLLVLIFVFTSTVCAATAAMELPASHPCCPPTNHQSQNNCLKMLCVSTVPVLVSHAPDFSPQVAASVSLNPAPKIGFVSPDSVSQPHLWPPPPDLFLDFHQFRI